MIYQTFGGYFGRLHVYGWVDHAGDDLQAAFPEWAIGHEHIRQARCIVAAESQAEAARLAGVKYARQLWNMSETGNVVEAGVALNQPKIIFWRPLDGYTQPYIPRQAQKC